VTNLAESVKKHRKQKQHRERLSKLQENKEKMFENHFRTATGNNCPDHIKFQWKIKIAKSTKSLNIPEKDRKNRHEKTKIPNNLENEICITKLDKNQSQPIKSKTTRQTNISKRN
jgi:hypothetical protein